MTDDNSNILNLVPGELYTLVDEYKLRYYMFIRVEYMTLEVAGLPSRMYKHTFLVGDKIVHLFLSKDDVENIKRVSS